MKGKIIYIVGDGGVGKTFLAHAMEERNLKLGLKTAVIDCSEHETPTLIRLILKLAEENDFVVVTARLYRDTQCLPLGWKTIQITQSRKREIGFTHSKS